MLCFHAQGFWNYCPFFVKIIQTVLLFYTNFEEKISGYDVSQGWGDNSRYFEFQNKMEHRLMRHPTNKWMAEESAAQFSRKAGDFVTFLINYNFKGVPDLHLQKLENICNTPQKQNSMIWHLCLARAPQQSRTHLDVEHSDEVRPLGVVFDQTGHSTASLHPSAAAICRIDLDHRRAQTL